MATIKPNDRSNSVLINRKQNTARCTTSFITYNLRLQIKEEIDNDSCISLKMPTCFLFLCLQLKWLKTLLTNSIWVYIWLIPIHIFRTIINTVWNTIPISEMIYNSRVTPCTYLAAYFNIQQEQKQGKQSFQTCHPYPAKTPF